jgi:hypothetical protein
LAALIAAISAGVLHGTFTVTLAYAVVGAADAPARTSAAVAMPPDALNSEFIRLPCLMWTFQNAVTRNSLMPFTITGHSIY